MTGAYLKIEEVQLKDLILIHDGEEVYRMEVSSPVSDQDLRDLAHGVFRRGVDAGVVIGEARAKRGTEGK